MNNLSEEQQKLVDKIQKRIEWHQAEIDKLKDEAYRIILPNLKRYRADLINSGEVEVE